MRSLPYKWSWNSSLERLRLRGKKLGWSFLPLSRSPDLPGLRSILLPTEPTKSSNILFRENTFRDLAVGENSSRRRDVGRELRLLLLREQLLSSSTTAVPVRQVTSRSYHPMHESYYSQLPESL